MPLVVATSVAGGMHALLFKSGPIFTVPVHHFSGIEELPIFVILGLACGLLAVVVCCGLFAVEAGFRHLPLPVGLHPVVDATGRCVGIVSRIDLLADGVDPDAPVMAVASADLVSVGSEDLLVEVIERIIDERVSHVPVLDQAGHLLGICTRTDILRVSAGRRETEPPQPGWRPSLFRSTSNPSHRIEAGGGTHAETREPNGPDRDAESRERARARRER